MGLGCGVAPLQSIYPLEGFIDPIRGPRGFSESIHRKIHWASIMAGEKIMTQGHGIEVGENLADREEIAQGLRHLLLVDVQKAVVQPVTRQWPPGRRFGLCDLVFVMRKNQIPPAAMDVERLPQIFRAHGRALDMPARTSGAPRTFPSRLSRLARFP